MERGEDLAGKKYRGVVAEYPELAKIAEDEECHEKELLGMLDDSHLSNMGSIVLGLNDALVELTGALAGFSHAMCDTNQVAKLGLITGMAAAMSMAASSFLSARADAKANDTSEEENKSPMISAFYTGIAYVITVFLLVAPYFIFSNLYCALISMLLMTHGSVGITGISGSGFSVTKVTLPLLFGLKRTKKNPSSGIRGSQASTVAASMDLVPLRDIEKPLISNAGLVLERENSQVSAI
jgi:VIT1/CCC1 family predicted Fe2+/Mn2+ transporter